MNRADLIPMAVLLVLLALMALTMLTIDLRRIRIRRLLAEALARILQRRRADQ